MTALESVLQKLKKRGERITPISAALLDIFVKEFKPLSTVEILDELKKRKIPANKTTVYRQIEKFLKNDLLYEVRFEDRKKRYELSHGDKHHHHLVCLKCGGIQDVDLPADLEEQEKQIFKKTKFKVLRHSLEFFGLCSNCQKKG